VGEERAERRRRGRIRIRSLIVAGIATCAFSAAGLPAAAQAAPFSLEFTNGFASIGCSGGCTVRDRSVLAPPDAPAGLDGTNTGGALSFPAAEIFEQTLPVTLPGDPPDEIEVTLTLTAVDPITGTYDAGTGQIDLSAPHMSVRVQTVYESFPLDCTINPIALTMTTESNSYHPGVRYTHGAPPAGPGALATGWDDLPAPVATDPLDFISSAGCPVMDEYIDGRGGLWLSRDLPVILPPEEPYAMTTDPASPNEANSILLRGSGAVDPGTVDVFLNGTCSGTPVGRFASSDFNGAGVGPIDVPEDDTTEISVLAHDLAERSSSCPAPYSYTDPVAPPPSDGGGQTGSPAPNAATTTAPAPLLRKCRKGRKLRKGRCVKRKNRAR
jgi:hypothetical protein